MKDQSFFKQHLIFTDGACSGNPGPGGFGVVVVDPTGFVTELGGGLPSTTNNQMELRAIISGLEFLKRKSKSDIQEISIITDSVYGIRGITQWIWGWRSKGWVTSEGNPVSNQEEWKSLLAVVTSLKPAKINWHFVRGHIGVPGNERCDEIAVAYSKNRYIDLYNGPLLGYPIAIHDIPEDTSLPEMKPIEKKEKVKAHSYLSYVHGVVTRHSDWASCERRVKGQSGAKFKKAMSESEEKDIVASWGLSPSSIKSENT